MRISVLKLLAKQVVKNAFGNKAVLVLSSIMVLLLVYAAITELTMYKKQTASQLRFQKEVRANWEKMPDKHPHRMAHYGYIVFRPKIPLSFFDFGIESYTGNGNQLQFLDSTTAFHERERLYFYPKIFSESPVNQQNWSNIGATYFTENIQSDWLKMYGPTAVITILLSLLCALNFKRRLLLDKA